jgi:DNA (cytosine-5)-methyltransferase 1
LKTARRPTALDLFAGVGGLSLGLEQAGFDVVAAVENDPIHAAVYGRNFPEVDIVCTDIRSLAAADLPQSALDVDVVVAGFPSPGCSIGGVRDEDDERNALLFEVGRIVASSRIASPCSP